MFALIETQNALFERLLMFDSAIEAFQRRDFDRCEVMEVVEVVDGVGR